MKPIKICFFSLYTYHYFNPRTESNFGGAERQLYYLARELAKDSRFEVNFIVGDFGQPEFEIIEKVKLYKFFNPQKGLKYLRAIFGFIKLWCLLKKINAHLYIQRAVALETGEVALFCKFNKKKFIYMVANDEDLTNKYPSYMKKGIINFFRWKIFQMGLKIANLVIVQNQEQKENLKKYYGKEGIIRKCAHPIPEKIDFNSKEFVLWVARVEKLKQPEVFIKLAEHFPQEKFVMICPEGNDKSYFQKIKKEAANLANLQFIDFVPFNEIEKYYSKAKVFVNTSATEGFPNTFVEAAKTKTPILSFKVNPDNILERYQIGRCAYSDFKKLKSNLKELLENQKIWLEMLENAYKYAKEKHDLKKIIKEDKKIILIYVLRR